MPDTFESVLSAQGILFYKTSGKSMEPLLRQNRDVVQIESKPGQRFCKNDVVLYKRPDGSYILHRILKVQSTDYLIIGDNCLVGEYVKDSQILGVLTSINRKGREISTTAFLYRLYIFLWCDRPVLRKLVLGSRTVIHNLLNKF